jgi:hypothetical protein
MEIGLYDVNTHCTSGEIIECFIEVLGCQPGTDDDKISDEILKVLAVAPYLKELFLEKAERWYSIEEKISYDD